MRDDMAKVIVERPRHGARLKCRKGYHRERQRTPVDEWRKRESIFALKGKTKFFNEHLGPLRRFLRKQVGRPWNKVFAEICEHLRLDSVVQSHVRDHLPDIVALDVEEIDGVICARSGWRRGQPLEPRHWMQLYVCPRTGILRVIKPRLPGGPVRRIGVDAGLQYHRIDDRWYEVRLRPVPADAERCFDALLEKRVDRCTEAERQARYGFAAYALSKRPLNRAEARSLGKRVRAEAAR